MVSMQNSHPGGDADNCYNIAPPSILKFLDPSMKNRPYRPGSIERCNICTVSEQPNVKGMQLVKSLYLALEARLLY